MKSISLYPLTYQADLDRRKVKVNEKDFTYAEWIKTMNETLLKVILLGCLGELIYCGYLIWSLL